MLAPKRGSPTSIDTPVARSKMSAKAALVVPALRKHTSTVIVAHGLGDRSGYVLAEGGTSLTRMAVEQDGKHRQETAVQ